MFSDSNGLMYASRRQYLTVPSQPPYKVKRITPNGMMKKDVCRDEVLRPPELFLTRAQARRLRQSTHHRNWANKAAEKQQHRRKLKQQPSSTMIKFDYNPQPKGPEIPDDVHERFDEARAVLRARRETSWEQVKECGVTYWRNTATGEAQVTSPFPEEPPPDKPRVPVEEGLCLFPTAERSAEELADLSASSSFAFMAGDDWLTADDSKPQTRFPPIR